MLHSIMSTSNNMASAATTTRTDTPTREGSRTVEARPQPVLRLSAPSGVLRLRAEPTERRHIQWAEDVIDNEGMGKKSSKGRSHHTTLLPKPY
jgi:protein phosphatase 1 regulatory subunit 11